MRICMYERVPDVSSRRNYTAASHASKFNRVVGI